MDSKFINELYNAHLECPTCATPEEVNSLFVEVLGVLFPDFSSAKYESPEALGKYIEQLKKQFIKILSVSAYADISNVEATAESLFEQLPKIYDLLSSDVTAMYNGDPAATSEQEVIRSYPGFYAIAAYRISHEMYKLGIKLIPRIITEHAHSLTGIDIHPGATIGRSFCIDHGTGVVIGETTHIGVNVKIYQGVTLGALSVAKELANSKRHPTIEDGVILYAGATVLGGDTTIGENSIIGGNTWTTNSLPANSKKYFKAV